MKNIVVLVFALLLCSATNLLSQVTTPPFIFFQIEQAFTDNGETHIRITGLYLATLSSISVANGAAQGTRITTSPVVTAINTNGSLTFSVPPQPETISGRIRLTNMNGFRDALFTTTVNPPQPIITSLSATSTPKTTQATLFTIIGNRFIGTTATMSLLNSTGATVGTVSLPITSSSATQLVVSIPAGTLETAGTVSITVANGQSPGVINTTTTTLTVLDAPTTIPTVGEWSMIVLTLSLFCIAVMYVRKPSLAMGRAGRHIGQPQHMPVQSMFLGKEDFVFSAKWFFPLSFIVTVCVWASCIYFHETAIRDVVGTALTGIVGGYLLQLLAVWAIESDG